MSIFNELLPKISEISNAFTKNFNDDLKAAFLCFDKFEEEFQNGKNKSRDKAQKDKSAVTILQSINEDDDEPVKVPDESKRSSSKSNNDRTSSDSAERRGSKKRSKNEVDGMESPEQDKRQKRNASVKAQSIISKQVNVNLTQKLRRENSLEKSSRSRRRGKEDDKENAEPVPIVQVKQEKISLPPEPMDLECLPLNADVKQEVNKDDIAMPPPVAPVPKPRKVIPKEKPEEVPEEETSGRRRTTRTRKQTDTLPARASNRSTRASSRSTKQTDPEEAQPTEARPKRTRAKKVPEPVVPDAEKEKESPVESEPASPAEKPRTKRTRRVQKATEKEPQPEKVQEVQPQPEPEPEAKPEQEIISPKEERISQPEVQSPVLLIKKNDTKHKVPDTTNKIILENGKKDVIQENGKKELNVDSDVIDADLDKTKLIGAPLNTTVVISNNMDKTVVLPNGVYNHAPVTPKNVRQMNETVVLETCNQTVVLDKPQAHAIMDATVVLDKEPKTTNITDDNSLLTDDSDSVEAQTPPKIPPLPQPTSAVKEKVQQFEEMATRVTRTKTRAMAKKDENTEQTPPDKVSKAILSAETLSKMNSMIFNGKVPQISSSATKPRVNMVPGKSYIPSSTSKLSGISRAREAEESQKKEKEDPRSKKEALLDAKRELQKKRREEKMAAAAAARSAAERERKALLEAAARERQEKQAHADQGKLERMREAERKKLELARKVAETEERRKAEEQARQQRLADEQKRAEAARKKQLEEAEAMKKEAAIMAKEIERRQKEFMERQKMKQRMDGDKILTPLKGVAAPEPVYMADGFQYLNSDEDEEPPERPAPAWSTSKARRQQLVVQARIASRHVDRLFSVRAHSPDLREIFPHIERARLKRTSSAVWRTPPRALPPLQE